MATMTLFVGNLDNRITEDVLEDYFSYYGDIRRCSIPRGKPFAFVEFRDLRDARHAQRGMSGAAVCGCELSVDFARHDRRHSRETSRSSRSDSRDSRIRMRSRSRN